MKKWTLERICKEMEHNNNRSSLYKLIVQSNCGKKEANILLPQAQQMKSTDNVVGKFTESLFPDFIKGNFDHLSTINHMFRRHGAVSLGLGIGSAWLCYRPAKTQLDIVCGGSGAVKLITPELSETQPYWFRIEKTELFDSSGFKTFYQVYKKLKQSDLLHKCPSYTDGGDLQEQIELVRSFFGNQSKILLWRSMYSEKFEIEYTQAHLSLTVPYLDCAKNTIESKKIKISKGGKWNDLKEFGDDAEEKPFEEDSFITVICK